MKKFAFTFGLLPTLSFAMGTGFSDVSSDHEFHASLNYVQEMGIVSGYPDGTFQPEKTINRAELTKILAESQFASDIEGCTQTDFPDVPADAWFSPYVCAAVKAGVVSGYPDGTYQPAQTVNVAEASKMIVNSFGLETQTNADVWFEGYLMALGEKSALPVGIEAADGGLTRGQMAEIIFRLKTETTNKPSKMYMDGGFMLKSMMDMDNEAEAEMNIVETAIATDDLSTLVAAVQAADLVDMLQEDGPYTVFAPTNAAFANIQDTVDQLLLPENKTTLQGVLAYHVVAGNVMASDLSDGMVVTTAQGQSLMVSIMDGKVMINGAEVVMADVKTSNGVVHVIDTVLVPSSENEAEMDSDTEIMAPRYEEYTAEMEAELNGTQTYALYFKADWCPVCQLFETNLQSMLAEFPEGTVILKADYDTETELKEKYNVTAQTTFIVVDAEGNIVFQEVNPDIEPLKVYWQ